MGWGYTFGLAPVGVVWGRDGRKESGVEADGPIFGGASPRRRGCLAVGECMTGCRRNAKNTLVKNYLYLAERAGAVVYPETTAVMVWPLGNDGYAVDTVRTGAWRAGRTARRFAAKQVVFAAGTRAPAATAQDAGRLRCDRRVSEPQPLGACSQQPITGQDHPPVYPHRCDALCSHCRSVFCARPRLLGAIFVPAMLVRHPCLVPIGLAWRDL